MAKNEDREDEIPRALENVQKDIAKLKERDKELGEALHTGHEELEKKLEEIRKELRELRETRELLDELKEQISKVILLQRNLTPP